MRRVTLVHHYNLAYVGVPKAGSTTMLKALLELAGVQDVGADPRRVLKGPKYSENLMAAGLESRVLADEQLIALYNRYRGYRWVATIRDPSSRLMSAYKNKVNRYARRSEKIVYLRGKIAQVLAGPKAWKNYQFGHNVMRQHISPDAFVHGVAAIGVDFDGHSKLQTEHLVLDKIDYDLLLRIERLEEDYERLGQAIGLDSNAMPPLPWRNASERKRNKTKEFGPESLALIAKLYQRDYENLGYAKPV